MTDTAQTLSIEFERCSNKEMCKTDAEIDEWISDKFIIILYNGIRFNSEDWGPIEDRVEKESRLLWIPMTA